MDIMLSEVATATRDPTVDNDHTFPVVVIQSDLAVLGSVDIRVPSQLPEMLRRRGE